MNIQGVRILGFLSVVLGSATFGVCGWMLITYQLNKPDVQEICSIGLKIDEEDNVTRYEEGKKGVEQFLSTHWSKFAKGHDDFYFCIKFIHNFLHVILKNALFSTLISVFQVVISAFLIASTPQEASSRTRNWIVVNVGLNLIYFVCLTTPLTTPYPIELDHQKVTIILSKIRYLPAFFIVLKTNVLMGFITLLYAMIALRYHNDTGYSVVTNV